MTFVEILNLAGLVANVIGGVMLFIWGPPQPSFEEQGFLALEGGPDLGVRSLRRRHEILSRVGLGLVILGFAFQLVAARPFCAWLWNCQTTAP